MDVVDRINKLLERAANAASSESETTAAFKIAERLMQEHGVTEDQLRRDRASKTGAVKLEWVSPRKNIGPLLYTLNAVASLTDTRSLLVRGETTRAVFIGYETDAQLAVYLTDLIENAMRAEYAKYYASYDHPKGRTQKQITHLKKSFLLAMSNRIRSRVVDMVATKAMTASRGTGTNLVVLKREIVNSAVDHFFPTHGVFRSRKKVVDGQAYRAGLVAGDRTNITTGIPAYA